MMKRWMLMCLLSIPVMISLAQQRELMPSYIDSLKKQLTVSNADTNRVRLLDKLIESHFRSNPQQAMRYAREGKMLAERIAYKEGEIAFLNWIGLMLMREGRYPEAMEQFLEVLKIGQNNKYRLQASVALRGIGAVYAAQGDLPKAMVYYTKAKKIQQHIRDDFQLSITLRFTALAYAQLNRLDSASAYFNRAYQLVNNKFPWILDDLLTDMGQLQSRQGNNALALTFFRKSIPLSIGEKDYLILTDAYVGVANLFHNTGQKDSSILYAQNALTASRKINYLQGVWKANQLLSDIYAEDEEHLSFKYYKMAMAAKDSMFNAEKVRQVQNLMFVERQRQQAVEAARLQYQNRLKQYGLTSVTVVFLLLVIFFYRNSQNKKRANFLLLRQNEEIEQQKAKAEQALEELKATQAQLIQREKMASLGELTAGIAHEIQNPLNFINNFSEINQELLVELKEEIAKGNMAEVGLLASDLAENEQKIHHHGQRADAIVKGMLQHSRASSGQKQPTDINVLAEEYLRLSYHGLRAKDKDFNASLITNFDSNLGKVSVVPQELGRVLLNLFNNAFYATQQKKAHLNGQYEPEIRITTCQQDGQVEIKVHDNGTGIPENIRSKIFQPFFTTKPTGRGTGLGLSLSYDIITKGIGGELKVETKEGEFAEFIISLPL